MRFREFKLLSQAIAFVNELRANHGDPGYPLDVSVVMCPTHSGQGPEAYVEIALA